MLDTLKSDALQFNVWFVKKFWIFYPIHTKINLNVSLLPFQSLFPLIYFQLSSVAISIYFFRQFVPLDLF